MTSHITLKFVTLALAVLLVVSAHAQLPASQNSQLPALPEDLSTFQCSRFDGPACDQHPAPPPDNPLVGSWVRISLLRNGYSQQPPSAPMYLKLGSDGYWSMMEFPADRPKVKKPLAEQTTKDLLRRFDRMEGAYGRYFIDGQLLDRRHVSNLSPSGAPATVLLSTEGSQVRSWHFEGNILALLGTAANRSPQARMRRLPAQKLGSTALVGTWERTAYSVNGQTVAGPRLQQWIILGEDGWFHQTAVPPGRRNPNKPMEQYTVQDYVDGFSGLSAARGIYDVRGATLIRRHVANLDPNLTGWEELGQFVLNGEALTIEGKDETGAATMATYRRLPRHDPYSRP